MHYTAPGSKTCHNRVEKVLPEIPKALSAARVEHRGPVGKLGCAGIALIEPGQLHAERSHGVALHGGETLGFL